MTENGTKILNYGNTKGEKVDAMEIKEAESQGLISWDRGQQMRGEEPHFSIWIIFEMRNLREKQV